MEGIKALKNTSATRVVASSVGVVAGLAGLEHGFFEVLQVNISPSSMIIEAIGPAQRFRDYGREPAFTIIPNYLITGILAMIVGLLVIIWTAAFIDRKYGVWVLMFLSILLFLVGGGFAPTVFSMIALVTAAMINRPLTWWHKHFPHGLRDFLARLWKWPLVALVFLALFLVELAIFGCRFMLFFSADKIHNLCRSLGIITFYGLGPVVILTALAYDIREKTD